MRKLFFLLAFLCCVVTQMKADVIQPATTPYYPEHVYTMVNANGWYADANTHGTQNQAESGHFAFYPVSGIDNAYYIYSVDNNKWLTYTKAASYSNTRNFISMNSSFGIDDYFYLNQRQNGYYDIAPYNTSGVASKYLNWFEGANESHTTIGLWQQNLNDDPGSKFSFTEVTIDSEEIPYFTVTSKGRGTWVVSNSMTSWESQKSATLDDSNELQHFAFIKKNGNVYLYNKGISKYINKDYSFTDDPKDSITFLYGNAIDGDKENNLSTDNSFVICFDNSNFINLGGERQIVIDGWGPNSASNGDGKTDIGNCVTITKQGTFTIKQPVSEITTGVYEMYNMDTPSRGYLVHSTDYPNKIKLAECNDPNYAGKTYADRFHTSLNSYWYVYQSDKGNTYIFSLANGLFITDEGIQAVTLTDTPEPVILENKTDKVFNIKSSERDYYLDAAVGWGNNTDNIIWVNNNTDGGCPYSFYPATKEVNATMLSTALAAIQNAEKGPDTSADDLSEELAPLFGKVDIEGIKVNDACGAYSNEEYGGYKNWGSDKVTSVWVESVGDVHNYENTPLVSISAFRYDTKEASPRLYTDGDGSHTLRFSLSTYLTGMTLQAAPGYTIVGYCFDHTASHDITDVNTFEGEITATAGTHHVELKDIEVQSTDIYFGQRSAGEVTLSNFYVFVRKGTPLTQEKLETFKECYFLSEVFTLAAKGYPNSNLYAPQGKDMLDICGEDCHKYNNEKATAEDLAQQFMLIPFDTYYSKYTQYNGCYVLYNLGAGKFVSKQGKFTTLTEHPRQAVSIEEGTGEYSGYFKLSFNKQNLLNVSPGYCKADDEETSCVVTNWNTLDDGNHFKIRIVRDLNQEAGNLMDSTKIDMTVISDASIIESKVAELQAVLDKDGVGYPTNDYRTILEAYKENVNKYKEQTALFDLEYFLPEYKSTTSVKMPQNGKAYRIKSHYMGTRGRYLKAAEGGVLSVVNEDQHETDNSTVFVARSIDEAANGEGTFAFVGENGQFLVGARTGTQGFVPTYNDGGNTGDLCVSTAANKGDYFGGFILKTTEGTNTYNLQLGASGTGTNLGLIYDAENPNSIINDPNGGSSIFFLEEVNDYPNVVKLREPAVADGKAYSSIWLPFSVEIPEGVRAYKAHIDYTTNQLVCGEVKNILPGGEGAILISEEAQEIVLAPATADVAPLQDNDLQGTNVTLARNTGVTTFVLNGSKAEIGFYPYTGANIAKYKAYVEVDKAQAAQGLRFSFGTATDIENTLTEGEGEAKEYYDLSGRRVAQPTKGLYIVNGKKMYIK